MIRSETITMIREKAANGKSAYAIGKELGISKNTAKKFMERTEDVAKKTHRASKLDPYKPLINELMNQGVFNCVVILERIKAEGYDGKISILKEYVHPFRPAKAIPAVRRYETKPGKQAQMDWGICQYIDAEGQIHKVPVFAMILGHSRMKFIKFVKRCDQFSLQRCMLDAFEYFGGVPQTILTDKMKTVVIGHEGGKAIWNPSFLDFCNDMGVVPKVCKVRRPQTKGKVERLVRHIKENFMPARTFTDLGDLNKQALIWCDKENSKQLKSTGLIPIQELQNENLQKLPSEVIRNRYRYESRSVSKDGFISYDGVKYGVPWEYSGKTLTVRASKDTLEIFDGIDLVSTHKIEYRSGRIIFLNGQYQGLSEKNGLTYMPSCKIVSNEPVEIRSLKLYDELMEVSNG